ncbi:putative C6 transcription factor [Aspergillus clavatus NRRL 1]|uniref:C6 transcription factor, putative n=1 Tax=Aspergillus clavatus (strain ATCC 1007 / CBS 513.65 / DSM 816 / NCTC 3887 / NRRL 1 / QM 1276 / 107) TaxID=344612 RepID=A1C8G8_ASPCL|nr:C6 transcription factor, putative [Aspergillus clavatus NRRL 1]EAW13605.1 C6 transcription factor, putative [Aspergillus clavatus NRRL 1]
MCVYGTSSKSRSWYSEPVSPPQTAVGSDNGVSGPFMVDGDRKTLLSPFSESLGLTSYSGPFSEEGGSANGIGAPLTMVEYDCAVPSPKQVQLGARLLLTLFENLSLYENVSENLWDMSPEGCVVGYQLVRMLFTALKDAHRPWAIEGQDAKQRYFENLMGWSRKIFNERSDPIHFDPSTSPDEYIRLVAGRWEGIGLVFAVVGQGAMLERDWKSVSQIGGTVPADQRSLGILAATASDACLQFCDDSGVVHNPLGWLLYQHTHLLTLVYGNNDYRPWRKLAQLSTVTFSLSLHYAKHHTRMPFFLEQLHKRLMTGAYSMDKHLATFVGRPPQISWRYCDVQLPLDLGYDEILADPHTRDIALSRLDANGWNTAGVIHKAQWMRVALLIGSIREQILELSLSRYVDDLPQKAKQVSENSRRNWDELPSFLRWYPGRASSDNSDSLLIPLYLDFLYNDFLLNLLLVKRSQNGPDVLITVAQRILSTVLELIGKELASGAGMCKIGWNACFFGIPAAGVLAIELLCQTNASPQTSLSTSRRPETIQNLSVFTSYLQYLVQPHEGNYHICQQARRVLGHILNHILSTHPPPLPSALPTDAVAADWLNGEGILLEDGTSFVKWAEGSKMDLMSSP